MPTASIIIPVFNRASLTRQCLTALLNQPYAGGAPEIIVVDDASTDLTPQMLAEFGGQVRAVRHEQNRGFAISCNDGAAAATGDYLVFLNNDTLPQPGWLDALVDYAAAHPAAAAVGSKLLFPNDTIQHAGVVISQDRVPHHIYIGFPADHPAVNKSRRFPIVTGACVLFCREPFFAAGGFDTGYLNGYEDVDLCLRLGEAGYEVHYCHTSVVYHLESATRARQGDHIDLVARLYQERWAKRVQPDDLAYYVEDGLLKFTYTESYPLMIDYSPLLAARLPREPGLEVEQLLNERTTQVCRLLREVARLPDRTMTEVVESLSQPPQPAHGPVALPPPNPDSDADLIHPDAEDRVGQGDPWAVGRLYLRYFIELGGLRPHERVLDVGSGIGRMALPLAHYLNTDGSYNGFEIVPELVEWCQAKITPRYPQLRFQHADVFNARYNPAGRVPASEFRFPFADGAFDFVFLTSVFTHMLPDDVDHYVGEIARVLAPGGRCLCTFFLLDEENLRLVEAGQTFIAFPIDRHTHRLMYANPPEAAVAYPVSFVRGLFARHGLAIREPLHFGSWSGRAHFTTETQDIVVAEKPHAAGQPPQLAAASTAAGTGA